MAFSVCLEVGQRQLSELTLGLCSARNIHDPNLMLCAQLALPSVLPTSIFDRV